VADGGPSATRPEDRFRVLVVEDDPDYRLVLTTMLEASAFESCEAEDGPSALAKLDAEPIDLVLLDLTLPGMDGLGVLRTLRSRSEVPVIVLSGRNHETERVTALEAGADDYVLKPPSIADLLARIRAVLRRSRRAPPVPVLVAGDLRLDTQARQVHVADAEVALTALEFDLLAFLSSEPRRAFSREDLLRHVWRSQSTWQDPETVTEHVRRIRGKLAAAGLTHDPITTIRGYGYRFDPPADAEG
jgi:DNA-binding response OmpR family regulator